MWQLTYKAMNTGIPRNAQLKDKIAVLAFIWHDLQFKNCKMNRDKRQTHVKMWRAALNNKSTPLPDILFLLIDFISAKNGCSCKIYRGDGMVS